MGSISNEGARGEKFFGPGREREKNRVIRIKPNQGSKEWNRTMCMQGKEMFKKEGKRTVNRIKVNVGENTKVN